LPGALPLWVWAVGVGNHRPPPNVGYPVGGQSKFRYVALQVTHHHHYYYIVIIINMFVAGSL